MSMNSSENIGELAAALVSAQAEFAPAIKNAINPAFKRPGKEGSPYLDLAGAIEAAQPALLKNGIAVLQGTSGDISKSSISVTTRLLHKSGQWIEDTLTLPGNNRGNFDAQGVGSAITYGRRYSYMAMLGFAAEDDDGNAASHPPAESRRVEYDATPASGQPSSNGAKISEAQSKRFFAMAKTGNKSNDDIRAYLLNVCKCEKSLDIPRSRYEAACKWAESAPNPTTPDPTEITDDDIPF